MGGVDGVYREWAFQKGGTGAVAKAVASAAVHHGAVIRTDCEVAEVIVSDGQAAGVRLVNGEEFKTKAVVSAADPKRTFLDFLDPQYVPDDLRENIERWKIGGCSAKVNIALDALPTFTCLEGRHQADYLRGAIAICPSMDYVEQAYDDAKYGNFSQRPYIDAMIPSLVDPDMAPPGKHVMSCFVQYAPDNIDGGWDEAKREAFGEAVIDAIAAHAPDIREKLIGKQVLVPPDITAIAGITGGNIFHGELYLHQVWALRPGLRWSRYRTPVENYWQCGSGTHPGGGISGTSGRLAALEMLGRG
jgi:phytoene dehydrogenase-like protein